MSDDDLAAEYGISNGAIRKHRFDDKARGDPWLTPKQIREIAAIEQAKAEAELAVRKRMKFSSVDGANSAYSEDLMDRAQRGEVEITNTPASEVLADKLLRDGEQVSEWAMEIIKEKLGFALRNPQTIKKLESIQDVSTALTAGRKAAGMDKAAAAVTLQFTAWKQPKSVKDCGELVPLED